MDPAELDNIIQAAKSGYWLPMAVLGAAWSVIIILLIYIYNTHMKANRDRHEATRERHEKMDVLIEKLTQSSINTEKLLAIHDVEIGHLKTKG